MARNGCARLSSDERSQRVQAKSARDRSARREIGLNQALHASGLQRRP